MLEIPNYKFLIHATSCSIRRTAKAKTKRLYNEVACGGIVHGLRISTNGEIQLHTTHQAEQFFLQILKAGKQETGGQTLEEQTRRIQLNLSEETEN